ncbi:MAG: hypothetical protein FJ278_11280, partial [Planctomycetes bacterium]|nr:hypothetical protein [Planctomycetota bacterium]
MSRRELALFSLAAAVTLFVLTPPPGLRGQEQAQPKSPQAWTLGEAMGQLALNPKDVYLQYVALQLARQENRLEKTTQEVEQLIRREPWRGPDRRQQVDLFSLFTGALAVQESLQLDTMRGGAPRRVQPVSPPA